MVVLFAFLLIPIMAMVAFIVDYGYLISLRVDLQRAADQAALAAVRDLVPDQDGLQNLIQVKATLREYVQKNLGTSFTVRDEDIVIGRYNPANVYSNLTILNDGTFDTVKVTLRLDQLANNSISLYFAKAIGVNDAALTANATAVLQKGRFLGPGTEILPIAIPQGFWDGTHSGGTWSIYGSGKITDAQGYDIPGNYGTLDVGYDSNSSADLNSQILYGLGQDDLDALYALGKIPTNQKIDSQSPMWLNGDTGFSAGIKSSVIESHGMTKLVPIYDQSNDSVGGNLDYHVVGWGVVEIIDSVWAGSIRTHLNVKKSYLYDGDLLPHPDLAATGNIIPNAYTSPVLVD